MIHDAIFLLGNVVFLAALLPALSRRQAPPFVTCALTGTVVWIFALNFATIGLWASAAGNAAVAFCWTLLALQWLIPAPAWSRVRAWYLGRPQP